MPKKEKLVTRAVTMTDVTCMVVNKNTNEVTKQDFRLNGKFKTKENIKKAVDAELETADLICINVLSFSEQKILYGRTESDFLAGAKEMETRTKFKAE